ncbi:MAG: META domain-containing protein [Anaerolineales bacterium]|jgi:heat shock protein HslJ
MSTIRLGKNWIIILIFVSLLGCSQKADELAGTEWELISLNGKDLIEGTAITLEFTETYLGGQMGCNGYGGSPDTGKYNSKSNGTFQLEYPLAVTVQLCTNPEGIMEQESEYIEVLMAASHYQIMDDRLEINDEAGELMLVYQQK